MIGDVPAPSRRALLNAMGGVGMASLVTPAPATVSPPATGATVWIDDFLNEEQRRAAASDRPVDCTDAFAQAFTQARSVMVGPGHYALDGLRLPGGGTLRGSGGAVLHQATPDRPVIRAVSDRTSGQLADIMLDGFRIEGHPTSRAPLVLVEAKGAFAIWRSRFAFFAHNAFRALEVQASDANNIFECMFDVVSEGSSDTAVLVRGGVYNRYHLFLTQTQKWALDDSSTSSFVRVVAENCVIVRGQNNQVIAHVEGISAAQAADDAAISDQGFGNSFLAAEVNMSAGDKGKLQYAFRAFERSVFINPQIIGVGAPPHPFAPTANLPFTVINGRSRAAHRIEAVFDGSDVNHDPRNITFVGDVSDYTARPTGPGMLAVQRFAPTGNFTAALALTTQAVIVDAVRTIDIMRVTFAGALPPMDGATLSITTSGAITSIRWPTDSRFARLPTWLAAGGRMQLVYQRDANQWFAL